MTCFPPRVLMTVAPFPSPFPGGRPLPPSPGGMDLTHFLHCLPLRVLFACVQVYLVGVLSTGRQLAHVWAVPQPHAGGPGFLSAGPPQTREAPRGAGTKCPGGHCRPPLRFQSICPCHSLSEGVGGDCPHVFVFVQRWGPRPPIPVWTASPPGLAWDTYGRRFWWFIQNVACLSQHQKKLTDKRYSGAVCVVGHGDIQVLPSPSPIHCPTRGQCLSV